MQTWKRNEIDGQLSQIRIKLTREPETGGDTRHRETNQMVEIRVGRVCWSDGIEEH